MTIHSGAITCWTALVVTLAVPAAGQPARFEDLPSLIQPLDTVVLTDVAGEKFEGQLRSLTKSTMEVYGRDDVLRSFDRDSVQRIVLRDSVDNGARNGSIIGALPMLVAGLLINRGCLNEGGTCTGLIIGLTGLGAGVGAGIGAAIDASMSALVYERSAPGRTITMRGGARMSVHVAPTRASLGLSYGW